MNFWAGTWQMVNQWVAKRFIMEVNCTGSMPQPTPAVLPTLTRNTALISVYPNPAEYSLTARVITNSDEKVQFTIFNAQGQAKLFQNTQLNKGHNEIDFNISDLLPGIYYLNTTSKGVNQVIRFTQMN